jgi:multidrug efflux pump subunit AcrA (membrane-fusion protein)
VAEIDIQRKEGPGIWPWILGALALLLVIGAVLYFTGNDRDDTTPTRTEQVDPARTAPGTTAPGTTTPGTAPGAAPGTTTPGATTPGDTVPRTPGTGPGT